MRGAAVGMALALFALTPALRAQEEPQAPQEPAPQEPAPQEPAPPESTEPTPTPPPPIERVVAPEVIPERKLRAPRFGDRGVVFLSAYSSAVVAATTYSGKSEAGTSTLELSPGFDVFFWDHISLGLELQVARDTVKGYVANSLVENRTTSLAAGLRVGVELPLARSVSLFARGTIGYESHRVTGEVAKGDLLISPTIPVNQVDFDQTLTSSGPYLALFVPFVFRLTPGFYAGFGPRISRSFADNHVQGYGPQTNFDGAALLGVTWGGADREAEGDETPEPPDDGRFGDAYSFVFTGALGAGAGVKFASGSDRRASAYLSPGTDFFFAKHLSFGVAGDFGWSHYENPTLYAGFSKITSSSYGVDGFIGYAAYATESATIWPKLGIGTSRVHVDRDQDGVTSRDDYTSIRVEAQVPFLVHFSRHAFVGAAARISHEVSRTYDTTDAEALQTAFGLSFVAGGWL